MIQAITMLTPDEAALLCDALDCERVNTSSACRAIRCEKMIASLATQHDLDLCDSCQDYKPAKGFVRMAYETNWCAECHQRNEKGK